MGVDINVIVNEIRSLREEISRGSKEFIDMEDMQKLTGFSRSYIYKLTSKREIPFYRPHGGKIFFKRQEVEDWIESSRVSSVSEISSRSAYLVAEQAFRKTKK